MKILLLKDVYKLGHAGDVKKVADGYARNYLIPQGLATLANAAAIKQAENIKKEADVLRLQMNSEMSSLAEKIEGLVVTFASKAGETGKLYGSITPQMIAAEISVKSGSAIDKRLLEVEPIRTLGEHPVTVRLTVDIVPTVRVIVHREGEKVVVEAPEVKAEETDAEELISAEQE